MEDMYLESPDQQLTFDLGGGMNVTPGILEIENLASSAFSNKKTTNQDLLNEDKKVVVSNKFVVALEEGSRLAHKISRIAIAQISATDTDISPVLITTDDMLDLGLTRNRLSSHMNAVVDEILSYRIKIASFTRAAGANGKPGQDTKLTGVNMFSMASACGRGELMVQLNPMLKEHFLQLKENFTQYELPVITRINSFQATKLHELILSKTREYGAQMIRFHITDLAVILNYRPENGKYKPSTFVNSVIRRAVATINESTGLTVQFKAIRIGKEYKDIRFFIEEDFKTLADKNKAQQDVVESANNTPALKNALEKRQEDIHALLESGEGEVIFDSLY